MGLFGGNKGKKGGSDSSSDNLPEAPKESRPPRHKVTGKGGNDGWIGDKDGKAKM